MVLGGAWLTFKASAFCALKPVVDDLWPLVYPLAMIVHGLCPCVDAPKPVAAGTLDHKSSILQIHISSRLLEMGVQL